MDNLILKPDKIIDFVGWKGVNLEDNATTNVTQKNYSYLLSLIGVNGVRSVAKNGNMFLTIGNIDANLDCEENQTVIKITENGIAVVGKTADAISNGVKMLIDMNRVAKIKGQFPIGQFSYTPKMNMRAVHMCIFKPNDGTEKEDTSFESLIKRVNKAALCGYNYIFLEFWGMFPYKKRDYAHWKNCYTKEQVDKLISFIIDDLHVTPIPTQNLTSHAGWSRITSRQHVVLDQRPDLSDMWIPGGWCFATTRQDTKEYLRDIMDDLIETFRNPPILHCSCDKCFGFGSTEEERVIPADDLFVNHIYFLHDYLKSRGVKMAMWADMLYSSLDVKYWKCALEVTDRLPKDILMNIWTHNDIGDKEWEDVKFFESKGFETAYSPFLDRKGAKNMVEQCFKNGSLGIIQTTWHKPETALSTVVYTGAYIWNGREISERAVSEYLQEK